MEAFASFFSGLGLSAASGLNAYLPMFTVGLLSRLGFIDLAAPFNVIEHPLVLLVIAALAVLDFAGDKIPAVDSALHALGMIVAPMAAAILFVASTSSFGTVEPWLAAIAGLFIGGGTHALRAAARPVVTLATGGTANPVVSLVEDIAALVLTIVAIVIPVLGVILALIAAFFAWRFFSRARRTWRQKEHVNGVGHH
ncbi:DUF4126 domain-containing protein [Candidatus Gracilibacteria bacterium]|nr:DUF4126 domain-containing protein [Candidatus Gracilibacteria bacterium]